MESSNKWMALAVIGVIAVYSSLFLLSSGAPQPAVQGGVATQLTYMVKGSAQTTNYWPLVIGLFGLLCFLLSGYYYKKK